MPPQSTNIHVSFSAFSSTEDGLGKGDLEYEQGYRDLWPMFQIKARF